MVEIKVMWLAPVEYADKIFTDTEPSLIERCPDGVLIYMLPDNAIVDIKPCTRAEAEQVMENLFL